MANARLKSLTTLVSTDLRLESLPLLAVSEIERPLVFVCVGIFVRYPSHILFYKCRPEPRINSPQILKVIRDAKKINKKAESRHKNMEKDLTVKSMDLENTMIELLWKMWKKQDYLTDDVIIEKARRMQRQFNASMPHTKRTNLSFSDEWLNPFKSRNSFIVYRIEKTPDRRVALLLDNFSAHGKVDILPDFLNAYVFYCGEYDSSIATDRC